MASSAKPLAGKIALVTGATRGIGKGIALQLGQAGATVYITGRTLKKRQGDKGSLEETAAEVESRGGKCIPVVCDHSKDDDIQKLFDRVKAEQNGQLDLLVNNAYSAVLAVVKYANTPFWEQPLSTWDEVNNVGLRNHYLCTVLAARLMVPRQRGLIVMISSAGGLRYFLNAAYGIGKEGCDRMAVDCATELGKHNVAVLSLWPGLVSTEVVVDLMNEQSARPPEPKASYFSRLFGNDMESTEYSGKAIVHLASDAKIMSKSGRVFISVDLGSEYGFVDINGRRPKNFRSLSYYLPKDSWLTYIVPSWIKIPLWVLHMMGYKF